MDNTQEAKYQLKLVAKAAQMINNVNLELVAQIADDYSIPMPTMVKWLVRSFK